MAPIAGYFSAWIVWHSAHLQGKETLALASRDELDQCRWVCIDADRQTASTHLRLVQQALEAHGLPSLLERSRRGGHLWLFFTLLQPVSSRLVWSGSAGSTLRIGSVATGARGLP